MLTSAGEREVVFSEKLPSKMMNNHVLIRVDFVPEDGHVFKTKGGLELEIAGGSYNEASHIARYGIVELVPDRLLTRFSDAFSVHGMDWITEIEIQPKDVVYFGKMAAANAPILNCNGVEYYIIPYQELILRVRDGEMYPLNGYALLEKKVETTRVDGLILDFGDFHNKKIGTVIHTGRPNDKYFGVDSIDADVSVGDEVIFAGDFFGFVEDDMFASLPVEVGYVQRRWIVGKL